MPIQQDWVVSDHLERRPIGTDTAGVSKKAQLARMVQREAGASAVVQSEADLCCRGDSFGKR
jgi:hypothetical protein